MRPRCHMLPMLAVLVGSCGPATHGGKIEVSIIGEPFRRIDPDQGHPDVANATAIGATATGLVAFDASGQVEPALAESWIVTGDGLSTVFRIRRATWPNGDVVKAADVASSLNRALVQNSRNALKPLLSAIDTVVAMTDRVVEIRLKVPRPNLLQLLAQPDLAIRRDGKGTGPYRIVYARPGEVRLHATPSDEDSGDPALADVTLRSERAARAVTRFVAERSDLVIGGTLTDWPIVAAARPRAGRLRFDPVQGLFGLAVVGRTPFLADADVRAGLAMAIDRTALARTFGLGNWNLVEGALPIQLDSARPPARPDWSTLPMAQRRADAAARIAQWSGSARVVPTLRVALPMGPGMRLLFARLVVDWRAIGVNVVAVPWRSPDADLRLIDAVAPNTSANWYLTVLSCANGLVCDKAGDAALDASRAADTLEARSARIADADAALVARGSFIALGSPLRWSLVDPTLSGWHENVFGAHPLAELRPLPSNG